MSVDAADAITAFLSAMEAAGVRPSESIASKLAGGGLVRFKCGDDRRPNGWAVLHLDGRPAGEFGWYRGGIRERWKAEGQLPQLSDDERRRQRQAWRETARRREEEKQEGQRLAAEEAAKRWEAAGPVRPDHPYLVKKAITGEGLRQLRDRLLVPMRDVAGQLWNVQSIAPDGFKSFLKGGRTAGLMCIVGGGGNRAAIGEGYATMAAVREATALPVVVAFSGENLEAVARAIRGRWPRLEIIVCADDDAHLVDHPQIRRNVGLEYGKAAAAAVGGRLAVPREAMA